MVDAEPRLGRPPRIRAMHFFTAHPLAAVVAKRRRGDQHAVGALAQARGEGPAGVDPVAIETDVDVAPVDALHGEPVARSEEHTSELQSLMRISYAVFCLTKQHTSNQTQNLELSSHL